MMKEMNATTTATYPASTTDSESTFSSGASITSQKSTQNNNNTTSTDVNHKESPPPTTTPPEESSSVPTPILALGAWLDTLLDTGSCGSAWHCSMKQWKRNCPPATPPKKKKKSQKEKPFSSRIHSQTVADDIIVQEDNVDEDDVEDMTTIATFSTATTTTSSSSSSLSSTSTLFSHPPKTHLDKSILPNDPSQVITELASPVLVNSDDDDDSSLHQMVRGILIKTMDDNRNISSHQKNTANMDPSKEEQQREEEQTTLPDSICSKATSSELKQPEISSYLLAALVENDENKKVQSPQTSPSMDRRAIYQNWKLLQEKDISEESAWIISQRTTANTVESIRVQKEEELIDDVEVTSPNEEEHSDRRLHQEDMKWRIKPLTTEEAVLCTHDELPSPSPGKDKVEDEDSSTDVAAATNVNVVDDAFALKEPSAVEHEATQSSFAEKSLENIADPSQLAAQQPEKEIPENQTLTRDWSSSQVESDSVTDFDLPSPWMDTYSITTADESLEQVYAPSRRRPYRNASSPSLESWEYADFKHLSFYADESSTSSSLPQVPKLPLMTLNPIPTVQEQETCKPSPRSKKNNWTRPWKFLRKRLGKRKKNKNTQAAAAEARVMKNTHLPTRKSSI